MSMDISSCHSSLKGNKQNIIGANTLRDVSRLLWTAGGKSNSFVLHGSRIYLREKKYAQNSSRLFGTTWLQITLSPWVKWILGLQFKSGSKVQSMQISGFVNKRFLAKVQTRQANPNWRQPYWCINFCCLPTWHTTVKTEIFSNHSLSFVNFQALP